MVLSEMCAQETRRAYEARREFSADTGCLPGGTLLVAGCGGETREMRERDDRHTTGGLCLVEDVVEVLLVASERGRRAHERAGADAGEGAGNSEHGEGVGTA